MNEQIKEWVEDWKEVRGKTLEFLKSLPEDKITWRPHELLGTFGMQIRHICISQRAYINGIKKGKLDFEDKEFDTELETNKERALSYLEKLDKELIETLEPLNADKEIIFVDGIYGESKVPLITILSYLTNHESYHQGVFTCYGRLAGLGKFTFM